MKDESIGYANTLSEKLGNNAQVQCVENVLIKGTAYVVALIESSRGVQDVPALIVFEDIPSNQLDPHFFSISNLSLGPVFSRSQYWVISTIYPLWHDVNIRMLCGRIELVYGKETILVIETQTIRDGWRMMVALSSTVNKSIAYASRQEEEGVEWLRPFALKGNPRFRRLSLPMCVTSSLELSSSLGDPPTADTEEAVSDSLSDTTCDSVCDSRNDSVCDSVCDTSNKMAGQSLLHRESVIRVFRHESESESEDEKEAVEPPALPVARPAEQSAVKREMAKRIKKFLFAADLDSVRPCDVHQFIRSQFSCYREHRDKYRAFVDESILVCYGQMDQASCILPGLFLGSEYNAADLEWLQAAGVRTIVNVSIEIPCFFEDQFQYHRIFVDDLPEVELSAHFDQAFEWIDSSLKEKKPVFVHCQLGVSRSASVVIAYLIKKNRWPYQQAFEYVRERRSQVRPNPGFVKQLEEYYLRTCAE
ncbi:DSP domain containing protein [Blastocystis sp. ATCC 50177/Nand II]|uniref:protein-serine/threonine phosphatase n=1 Tax=Blastocystis sp. subtype 1 (strain ATCC 50177 / NandII) TaxID=478820 RepID=A0A196S7M3_BLAHN|nr:DSP domain containing protein [Blastocystis sp. ATCC 50177/Nand II]